jgi:hypothetical protein
MKRLIFVLAAGVLTVAATGCFHHNIRQDDPALGHHGCRECGAFGGLAGKSQGLHETRGWRHQPIETEPAGPPTATVAYPYYTTRGPRDFLAPNPPSIGN